MRFIRQVDLTSGQVLDSYRHEVEDEAVTRCHWLIDAALADESRSVEVTGPWDGMRLSGTATSRNALLRLRWREAPVVTIGIATHSRGGASLWRLLRETATTPIAIEECPAEPWVAARLEAAAGMLDVDALLALADLGRCLGWGWIERMEAQRAEKA